MKTKIEIQKELINLFGQDYNSLDNLIKFLNKKYFPKYFNNFEEFCSYLNIKSISVDDYTDDYISKKDKYIVILFDDYRDFKGANEKDNFRDDVVVCYDETSKKIIKYFYTGLDADYIHDIDAFIDLENLEMWYLGKNKRQADRLFRLVLNGKKIATSYLYKETEKLSNNSFSILTDWDKSNQLLIFTTNIQVIPFNKVTKQHAQNEGEGTKTLQYWRGVHRKFFAEQLAESNQDFSEDTLIVCETFQVIKKIK